MRKILVTVALAAILATGASAQNYPSRPVTIVAPFPAGGPLDTIARIIAEPMREALGQPVLIENVAGAGGNIGTLRVARAEPDGYTVGIGQWSTHVVNPVTDGLPDGDVHARNVGEVRPHICHKFGTAAVFQKERRINFGGVHALCVFVEFCPTGAAGGDLDFRDFQQFPLDVRADFVAFLQRNARQTDR